MPGPYFTGQKPRPCGCFHPDVTIVRDDEHADLRFFFCINHGEYSHALGDHLPVEPKPIPSDEWREDERERLRNREKGE